MTSPATWTASKPMKSPCFKASWPNAYPTAAELRTLSWGSPAASPPP